MGWSSATRVCVGWSVAALLAGGGCYAGLHDGPDPDPNADGGDDDGAADGGDDDGSSTDPDGEPQGQCGTLQVGLSPLRRLTRAQYHNAVKDLLGIDIDVGVLPEDERADAVGAFASNVLAPVSENIVRDYLNGAELTASVAVEAGAFEPATGVLGCDPALDGEAVCAATFIAQFGRRAFRRPLTSDEQADFEALFAAAEGTFAERIALVVETALQFPDFLYLVELGVAESGDEIAALTDYELATRLSFFLWSTIPDDALLDAAAAGALKSEEGLREQAQRLLDSPRARDSIASFHAQWLGIDELPETDKSSAYFPDFDPELATAMLHETQDFADYVLRHDDGRLHTLLTASYTIAAPRLLELYGVDAPQADADGVTQLPASERAGLLTHASVLSAHAHADQASIVRRGVLVRRNLLCQQLPPPPPDVDIDLPEPDPNQSTRERFEEHRDNPSCAGCHDIIDPIGYGLLAYDAIGRRITEDGGQPIDESGTIAGLAGAGEGAFVGPVELAGLLADSEDVRACVATQWTTFALGHPLAEADTCTTDTLSASFEDSDGYIPALLVDIVTSDAFRYRRIAA